MSLTHAPEGTLEPGAISPIRSVPAQIERPEYVGKDREARFTGSEVKDAETVERIRVASRIAAQALAEVGRHVDPGVTTDDLDRVGHEFLCDNGAYPSTLHYQPHPEQVPFTKSLCTSVNEVICHGIPDSTVLRDGDIVNVDITGYIGGVHGDTSAMYLVGDVDEQAGLLVDVSHQVHRTRVAVHAADVARDVDVDDVAVPQHRRVRDPVADHLVDRGAQGLGERHLLRVRLVVQGRRVRPVVAEELVTHPVQVVGGDPWCDVASHFGECLGCDPGGDPDPLDGLGVLDLRAGEPRLAVLADVLGALSLIHI